MCCSWPQQAMGCPLLSPTCVAVIAGRRTVCVIKAAACLQAGITARRGHAGQPPHCYLALLPCQRLTWGREHSAAHMPTASGPLPNLSNLLPTSSISLPTLLPNYPCQPTASSSQASSFQP